MISILIPIFNGIEFIEDSVNSVINQTFEDWELLIGINGHSENSNTFQIAKKYENNKIKVFDFFHIKNKSDTLNELIKYCNYDYVALLDVDDIWNKNKLQIQSQFLGKYDVIGTMCKYFGNKTTVPNIPIFIITNYNFKLQNPICNSSVILKKQDCFWKNINIEDYELWLRLKKNLKTFYNCSEILVYHRIHSKSAFNSKGNYLHVKSLLSKY